MGRGNLGAGSPNDKQPATVPAWFLERLKRQRAKRYLVSSSLVNSCLLLPLICILLLPTIKFERDHATARQPRIGDRAGTGTAPTTVVSLAHILVALVRLPFDRLRLQSGLLISAAAAATTTTTGTNSHGTVKSDLQEEEQTHVMLLAPAEQRSSYVAVAQPDGAPVAYVEAHGATQAEPEQYRAGEREHGGPAGATGPDQAALVAAEGSSSASALQARADLPAVRALNVKCEKNHMTVNIVFDRPFYGLVFSKGHYNDQKCVHLGPNSGQTSVNFDIHLGKCGMSSSDASPPGALQQANQHQQQQQQQPNGVFIENTIIIQYDPLVQEIYDQARKLRCTWYDYYEKSVTFRPYNVDMLDAVTANFLGDNIQCWMQIQVGKGPWSSEVAGIVKIGQTMTMVLAIKDDENRFDMLVRNCVAHDGKHAPIQLVDEYGCVARPKIMSRFQKVRNFGPAATVVSYAHFQAFKFPDSMSVHFQCVIQVCRYECPEPVCSGAAVAPDLAPSIGQAAPQAQHAHTAPSNSDYAASGTEMVAAKEPLPVGYHAHPATSYSQISSAGNNQSHSTQQLRLDESQGRVQVRLDTSMMAGLARPSQMAAVQAPLPPHLLHMAPQNGATSGDNSAHMQMGRAFISAGPQYKPAQQQRRPAAVLPPTGGQAHYSLPYPQQVVASTHRSTQFAHRLGELAPDEHQLRAANGAPYEQPLSLIAAPRGLISGSPTSSAAEELLLQHRFKRSLNMSLSPDQAELLASRRHALKPRHLGLTPQPSSTSVQTQKTIQVVSPDDVAFSLMDPMTTLDDDIDELRAQRRQKILAKQQFEPATSVCFSAARFIWGALITVGSLASGIVAVVYVILRQRAQLEQKLSAVYDPSDSIGPLASSLVNESQQHQQQQELYRRQQAEIQQRNNYLGRLYSQFAPASYWR